jgi:hypothetical protein
MNEIDLRLRAARDGFRPDWASKSDIWFAWHPVRIGALGTGPVRFGVKLYRNRCCGVTIYQDLEDAPAELRTGVQS